MRSPHMGDKTIGVALAAVLLIGCGGPGKSVKQGSDAYARANYGGAMVQWRYVEHGEAQMKDRDRVRYLVYRGLTHYRLYERSNDPTDAAAALHFLARGQAAYDAGKPKWLDPETVSDMKVALARLAANAAAGSPGPLVVVEAPLPAEVVVAPPDRAAPPRD